MKSVLITCLFFTWIFTFQISHAQDKKRFNLETLTGVDVNGLFAGPRMNYAQGKDGFLGFAFHMSLQEKEDFLPLEHIGFAVGIDFRLSHTFLAAPKINLEYRYNIGIARIGYLCYTDFHGKLDNRFSAEIGFSFFTLADLTYVHTFGFSNNPFNMGNDYVNLTISISLMNKDL